MENEEELIYLWDESFFDKDGQLWVVTMLSILVLPLQEELVLQPMLFQPLRTCLKHL